MAKFCSQCGAQAKETAKFCGKCGNRLKQTQVVRPSGPPSPPPMTSPPAMASSGPPPMTDAPPPPQYWESYDYPSTSPTASSSTPPSSTPIYNPSGNRPHDASRPLPPLTFGPTTPAGAHEKARDIARSFALSAAGIVLVPIPFSDLVLLMPIQTAMVLAIGKAFNVKDPPEKTLAHIAAACGASVFGQITTLFVANLLPIIGKLVSAPFVYGWTYGLGEVAIRYFESQGEMEQDEMKSLFKKVSRDATRAFRKDEVTNTEGSFGHLREHLSEEDYRKLRERFSQ